MQNQQTEMQNLLKVLRAEYCYYHFPAHCLLFELLIKLVNHVIDSVMLFQQVVRHSAWHVQQHNNYVMFYSVLIWVTDILIKSLL